MLLALLLVGTVVLLALWLTGDGQSDGQQPRYESDSSYYYGKYRRQHYQRPIDEGGTVAPSELFVFDPNTADSTQLLRLGLQRWQVRNIYSYRRNGGIYRRPEDFARLYGLTVGQYERLAPYIRIGRDYQPAITHYPSPNTHHLSPNTHHLSPNTQERDTLRYPRKIAEDEHVVLNTADTTQLRSVPGIGTYFANEITNYGRFLGGYVSIDQLDEIPDFPQESKKYFVISNPNPVKLNVNNLSLNQLKRHPYINYYQAKAIVDYRRLHGRIESLQQLSLSKDFTPEAISRLEPYVEY